MCVHKQLLKLLLASVLTGPLAALAAPTYSLTFLPQNVADAAGVDNQGRVAVTYHDPFIARAGLWANGTITDLGSLGSVISVSNGISQNGNVAGYGEIAAPSFAPHAFVYSGGTMTDLGTLGGLRSSATAVNDSGQATGVSDTASGLTHAFRYSNGTMRDLGTLGSDFSVGNDINNAGVVVGMSGLGGEGAETHAFVYCDCGMRDLGTLEGGTRSSAQAINDAGLIAGISNAAGFEDIEHAFIYAGGVMTDIGELGQFGRVADINNLGQVVGWSANGAFLYTEGHMVDLTTLIDPALGWTVAQAYGINDSQQIVAEVVSTSNGSLTRIVRLDLVSAVPEPGAYAMLLAGLVLVSVRRRRPAAAYRCA